MKMYCPKCDDWKDEECFQMLQTKKGPKRRTSNCKQCASDADKARRTAEINRRYRDVLMWPAP